MNLDSPLLKGMRPELLQEATQDRTNEKRRPHDETDEPYDGRPSLQFANYSGDITITWEKDQEELIKKLVEQKMAEGYVFFIVKPRKSKLAKTLLGNKREELTDLKDLKKAESITIPTAATEAFVKALNDPEVAAAVMSGKAKLTKGTKRKGGSQVIPSEDSSEIVKNKAVGFRRVVGG